MLTSISNIPYIFILSFLFFYLLGSIPFGLIFTKIFSDTDIRTIGSGNIGATNVLRTGKKSLALLTLILDFLKAFLPLFLIFNYYEGHIQLINLTNINFLKQTSILISGFFFIIGHCYPIWLKFKGGKGVATTLAVIFALDMIVGVLIILIWVFCFLYFKISSLSALISVFFLPFIIYFKFLSFDLMALSSFISVFIFYTHKSNIIRLIKDDEKKF